MAARRLTDDAFLQRLETRVECIRAYALSGDMVTLLAAWEGRDVHVQDAEVRRGLLKRGLVTCPRARDPALCRLTEKGEWVAQDVRA